MSSTRRGRGGTGGGSNTPQPPPLSQERAPAPTRTRIQPPPSPVDLGPPALIAVMGATGSGKSTFINTLAGSDFAVGSTLQSCTQDVEPSPQFVLAERNVVLIDTPGFDDTTLTDTQVLSMIAIFLAQMYDEQKLLTGVIYLQRISDVRIGGSTRRNFDMFQKLCGEEVMKNVALVTNMWGLVDPEVAQARHEELLEKDIFFKPAIDLGALPLSHDNTTQSGEAIVRQLLQCDPLPLQIQRELVDEGRQITETTAGAELLRELTEMAERHRRQIDAITGEMREAIRNRDQEARRELEKARNESLDKQRRAEEEQRALISHFTSERETLAREVRLVMRELEEEREARSAQERILTQAQRTQQQRSNLTEQGNQRLRAQLAELQRRHNNGGGGGLSVTNLVLPAVVALLTIML